MASDRHVSHGAVVWVGKPWVAPTAIIRTIVIFLVGVIVLWLEFYLSLQYLGLDGLPFYIWTIFGFFVIWVFSLLELLVFWASNTYILRQDGLEIRGGIIMLHSFVVTPAGFGDLLLYQSIGGRIFGYGDITVNSQGERQTKLYLVRSPFAAADTIRDIMGKPIVRIDSNV